MLKVTELRKRFSTAGTNANGVDGISFAVANGEFFTLLGPSGCGKSTTLRCIAGLERVTSGTIEIDGQVVASADRTIEPNHRPISMVFQSYAIWPHMTVLENVTFPLSYRDSSGSSRNERMERGLEALRMVRLDHLADREAPFLSGGQQQRVALARSLVTRPKLLLLDEPLSNLDAKLREEMRFEIKDLTSRLGIASIYVTHDQAEALSMSDRIAVMAEGRILQMGTPRELYLEPNSTVVAQVVGNVNILQGRLDLQPNLPGEVFVTLPSGARFRCLSGPTGSKAAPVEIMFRPELVRTREAGSAPAARDADANILSARVGRIDFTGDHLKVHFETPDGEVVAKLPPDYVLTKGDQVEIMVRWENCVAH